MNLNINTRLKPYEIVLIIIFTIVFIVLITFVLSVCLNPIDSRNLISHFTDVNTEDRVFNIGLHRTGTSSLAEALTKLGYRVWHGPYFKRLENQYYTKFNALADTQVKGPNQPDFNFKRLYEKFPNAKFILTVRKDLDKWVESIYKSNRKYRPYRIVIPENYINTDFCKDLITPRQVRKRLKKTISELTSDDLKLIYRQHNREIIEFFKEHAPNQLLIFDVSQGDSWEKLCKFLNKPIPKTRSNTTTIPYPKADEHELTFKLSLFKVLGTNL